MADSDKVVIYDTPSRDGKTWSHHVLRILFSLHYKKIPYTIEAVEYPDINSTFDSTPLAPKNDPVEPYEIPVLIKKSPGGSQYFMETDNIIKAMEGIQPEPPLLYTSERSVEFRSRFGPALAPVLQAVVGHTTGVLSERGAEEFAQKRKRRWGKSVEQWNDEHPLSQALVTAEPRVRELGDWLDLTSGPFVHGDQPSYADFTIVSVLAFIKALGFGEAVQSVLGFHPAVLKLYNAVKSTQQGNARCRNIFDDE